MTNSTPRWLWGLSLLLVACSEGPTDAGTLRTIPIAAIMDFHGDNGQSGQLRLAAMQTAIEDANDEFRGQGIDFHLLYGDAETNPQIALNLVNNMLFQGARIVVGPFTSAEVQAVASRVLASNSLVLSPTSTSMDLASQGDHIYRLVPTDAHLVEALVERILEEGRRQIAIVYREDAWGQSISAELARQFEANGGTVVSSRSYLGLRRSLFQQMLVAVQADLAAAVADPSEGAVVMMSFDEGSLAFEVAAESLPALGTYRWYGGDGFVNDRPTIDTPALAEFAIRVRYAAPIFRVSVATHMQGVAGRIQARSDLTPDPYALLTYDAVRAAARALASVPEDASYGDLSEALVAKLGEMDEFSGPIVLDEAGDRAAGPYEFFTISGSGGSYDWVSLGS